MSSAQTVTLERSNEAPLTWGESLPLYRTALWILLAAKLLAGWGVQWDIQWHVRIGRDSFWIPPHVMTYAGVSIAVLVSLGVLACDTFRRVLTGRQGRGTVRILGLTGTPGFHIAWWGIALTVLAAPIDDLWHRLFGLDVTLWSPPHLLGLLGAAVNTLACFLIAREAYPARRWIRDTVLVIAASSLYGSLAIGMQPSGRLAYLYGGVWFYAYPILGALLLPLTLVTSARLTGRRVAPLVVLALVIVVGVIGARIAQVGFAILQPVSVIQEEIAKDPTSPIAVGYEIARKNGSVPGSLPGGMSLLLLSFVPVAFLVALDSRRWPVPATLSYAVGLFLVWGIRISRLPAFRPMVPAPGPTAVALLITLGMAILGAVAATWLADVMSRSERSPAGGSGGS